MSFTILTQSSMEIISTEKIWVYGCDIRAICPEAPLEASDSNMCLDTTDNGIYYKTKEVGSYSSMDEAMDVLKALARFSIESPGAVFDMSISRQSTSTKGKRSVK